MLYYSHPLLIGVGALYFCLPAVVEGFSYAMLKRLLAICLVNCM